MTNRLHHDRLQQLFDGACQLTGIARDAWLTEQCAGDAALRDEIEHLLQLDQQPPLCPDGRVGPVWVAPPTNEVLPTRIGRFEVLDVLCQNACRIHQHLKDDAKLAETTTLLSPKSCSTGRW